MLCRAMDNGMLSNRLTKPIDFFALALNRPRLCGYGY